MDGACHQLFAGAGLTSQEDGQIGGGNLIDELVELVHLPAAADELVESIPFLQLLYAHLQ